MFHPQSDRGRRTFRGPPARIRITLNFGVFGTATRWLMDPWIGEEHARLYPWKISDKQTALGSRIHWTVAWHLLATTFASSFSSINGVYQRRAGHSISRFYFASLHPDSSWMRDRDFQFLRQAYFYPVNYIFSRRSKAIASNVITINYMASIILEGNTDTW